MQNSVKYNKLVRDRIPEIIEASGRKCSIAILSEENYLKMLDRKLDEELAEYHKDQNIEELADLLEVIHAAAKARGYTLEELECVRAEKAAKRGGFEKRILLREVFEHRDYSFILLMREYLVQHGVLYSTTIPNQLKQRKAGKKFTFQDHLRGLVYALLSAHTQWSRIVPKLDQIDEIFYSFNENLILGQSNSYFVNALKTIKCASQCTNRQMSHLAENIRILHRIELEFESLDHYVTSETPEKIVMDLSKGTHKLYDIGPALAWEYLRNVGIDGVKPDIHVCRFLGAERIGLSNNPLAATDEAVMIVKDMSEQLSLSMTEIDSVIWSYCASNYGEICTASPKCEQCIIKEYCRKR